MLLYDPLTARITFRMDVLHPEPWITLALAAAHANVSCCNCAGLDELAAITPTVCDQLSKDHWQLNGQPYKFQEASAEKRTGNDGTIQLFQGF